MPMDQFDLTWGVAMLAVTAAGISVVVIPVIGIILLFRRLVWRRNRSPFDGR